MLLGDRIYRTPVAVHFLSQVVGMLSQGSVRWAFRLLPTLSGFTFPLFSSCRVLTLNSYSLMCTGKTEVLNLLLKETAIKREQEQKYIVQPGSRAYGVLDPWDVELWKWL